MSLRLPIGDLEDYDHPAQIGAEPSPEQYVQNLVAVFREVRWVLRDDGTVWLNVGDDSARNGGTGNCGPNAIVGNTRKFIQKRTAGGAASLGIERPRLDGTSLARGVCIAGGRLIYAPKSRG
ncbi:MAG: DNA methyltransferase [Pirellulales bacterium]